MSYFRLPYSNAHHVKLKKWVQSFAFGIYLLTDGVYVNHITKIFFC